MASIGVRIKSLLDKKGLTQKELANAVGCTEAAISHYIKGDRVPRASVLSKIAIALDIKRNRGISCFSSMFATYKPIT